MASNKSKVDEGWDSVEIHPNCHELRDGEGRPLAVMTRTYDKEPWTVNLPRGEGYNIKELASILAHVKKRGRDLLAKGMLGSAFSTT